MMKMLFVVIAMLSGPRTDGIETAGNVRLQAGRAPEHPHIVFMIGEDEYHTWETLPAFAKKEIEPRGYRVTIVKEDGADKNNFPGLVDALRTADVLVLSTRRRTPPPDQLNAVRAYLAAGKPLVGIRTACHAFALRPNDPPLASDRASWQEFDPEVLGGHYTNHYPAGPKTAITVAPGAAKHAVLKDVRVDALTGNGSLYMVSPLAATVTPLLIGTIPGEAPEPIAWTHEYGPKHARVFYTSLGHPDDFQNAEFRRVLVNGIRWALKEMTP
jgi:type 1 glutamine amidotransferase